MQCRDLLPIGQPSVQAMEPVVRRSEQHRLGCGEIDQLDLRHGKAGNGQCRHDALERCGALEVDGFVRSFRQPDAPALQLAALCYTTGWQRYDRLKLVGLVSPPDASGVRRILPR